MYKSIIFDMDGTLLDSSYAMTCSVNHVREHLGLKPIEKEFLEFHINEPNKNIAMTFYGTKEYTATQKELFYEHYMENSHLHVKPYAGVYEFLDFLQSKKVTMSIATNASDFFAKNMLGFCNMMDYFTHIIGANNVEKSKPNPDMIEHIVNLTSIPIDESILIGDSIKDEGAASNIYMDFIFAKWGYGKSESAKKQLSSIDELHNYFTKIL